MRPTRLKLRSHRGQIRGTRAGSRGLALLETTGVADVQALHEDLSQLVNLEDFRQYVSERRRASQLMAIADAAYEAGLRRLDDDIDAARPSTAQARSEFVRLTVIGSKPIGAEES